MKPRRIAIGGAAPSNVTQITSKPPDRTETASSNDAARDVLRAAISQLVATMEESHAADDR